MHNLTDEDRKYLSKYMISTPGKYAIGVYECPHCGRHTPLENFYDHICGFADTNIGLMKVSECPYCFEKYHSHMSHYDVSHFHWSLNRGTNKHFSVNDNKKKVMDEQKVRDFIYKTIPSIVNYNFRGPEDEHPHTVFVSFATCNVSNMKLEPFTHKHLNILAAEFGDDEIHIKTGINEIFLIIEIKNETYYK